MEYDKSSSDTKVVWRLNRLGQTFKTFIAVRNIVLVPWQL